MRLSAFAPKLLSHGSVMNVVRGLLCGLLCAGSAGCETKRKPRAPAAYSEPRTCDESPRPLVTEGAVRRDGEAHAFWAAHLAELSVTNRNTQERVGIRLYDAHGELDPEAVETFMRVVEREHHQEGVTERLDVRLLQLVVRAAYHFGKPSCAGKDASCERVTAPRPVVIVSGTRPRTRGKHGSGEAMDFFLEGVRAPALAAYLRSYPRAGVGIYTHPKTQYVHLDVREESYHWLDASPPGKTWRERALRDPKRVTRDASWSPADDLPDETF